MNMTARLFASILCVILFLVLLFDNERSALGDGGDPDRVAVLEKRIEKLEIANRNRVRLTDLTSLRLKVSELERLVRDARPPATTLSSQRNESMQRQATDSLKRSVSTLEAKVTTGAQQVTRLEREIDRLRLQLSTLQNKVDRLGR